MFRLIRYHYARECVSYRPTNAARLPSRQGQFELSVKFVTEEIYMGKVIVSKRVVYFNVLKLVSLIVNTRGVTFNQVRKENGGSIE